MHPPRKCDDEMLIVFSAYQLACGVCVCVRCRSNGMYALEFTADRARVYIGPVAVVNSAVPDFEPMAFISGGGASYASSASPGDARGGVRLVCVGVGMCAWDARLEVLYALGIGNTEPCSHPHPP